MTTVAVINNENIVINIIVAEITDIPQEGCILVELPILPYVSPGIGWKYDGTNFIDPNPNLIMDYSYGS